MENLKIVVSKILTIPFLFIDFIFIHIIFIHITFINNFFIIIPIATLDFLTKALFFNWNLIIVVFVFFLFQIIFGQNLSYFILIQYLNFILEKENRLGIFQISYFLLIVSLIHSNHRLTHCKTLTSNQKMYVKLPKYTNPLQKNYKFFEQRPKFNRKSVLLGII